MISGMPVVRIVLFVCSGLLALHFGFFGIDTNAAIDFIKKYGYWGIFFTFWGYVLCLSKGAEFDSIIRRFLAQLRNPRFYLFALVLLGCYLVLTVHEKLAFKILMDEVNLLGTSMSMHYDRLVLFPTRGYEVNGSFQILGGQLDKRPYFFPFLISILHDITGYRPENGFYLNQLLLLGFLCLLFIIGRLLGGFWAGIVCVLGFSSVPLLSQVSNGCGFELLNVLMIALVIYHSMLYLQVTNEQNLATLLFSAILLAQVRYESVIFVFPVGVVILLGWWKLKKVVISNVMIASPMLLLPYPLVNKVFEQWQGAWQMKDKAGVEQPFGFEYIYDNFGYAVAYFFSFSPDQPNNLVLAVTGCLGLVFYAVKFVPQVSSLLRNPNLHTAIMVCLGGLLGLFLLLMAYFWGQFTDPVVRRLSLPIFFLMIIPLVSCIALYKRKGMIYKILSGVFILAIVGDTIPTLSKNIITQTYMPGKHVQWQRAFLRAHPTKDFLMIDSPIMWVTHKIPAVSHTRALSKKAELKFLLDTKKYDDIYVYQRFGKDLANGTLVPAANTVLDDDFVLETVAQQHFGSISLATISRVVDIQVDETIQFDEIDFDLGIEESIELEYILQRKWMTLLP